MPRDDNLVLTQLEAAGVPAKGRWQGCLQRDDRGHAIPNLANAALALREAPELADLLAFDEMARLTLVCRTIPGSRMAAVTVPRPITDADADAIQEWLQHHELARLGREVSIPPARAADDQAFGGLRLWYSLRMRRTSSMPSSVKASTPSSSRP